MIVISVMEKPIVGLCLSVLVFQFGFLFYENLLFSENYDVMQFKDLSEPYHHFALKQLREAWGSLNLTAAFSEVSHSYGNFFWQLNNLFTFPFKIFGFDNMVIILPRQLSLFFYVFCFIAFFRFCRLQKYPLLESCLLMLLMASSLSGIESATLFHNTALLAFLICSSFYVLASSELRKYQFIAGILLGVAIGIKPTSLCFLPLHFMLFNKALLKSDSFNIKDFLKNNSIFAALIIASATLSFSPSVLFLPFGNTIFFKNLESLLATINYNFNHVTYENKSIWENFNRAFLGFHYHWCFMVLGLLAALTVGYQAAISKKYERLLLPVSFVLSLLLIIYFCSAIKTGDYTVSTYLTPFVFILPLILLEFGRSYRKWALFFISSSVFCNGVTHQNELQGRLLTIYKMSQSLDYTNQLTRYKNFDPQLIKENDFVLADHRIILPLNFVNSPQGRIVFYTEMMYPREEQKMMERYDVVIFSKKTNIWNLSCDDSHLSRYIQNVTCTHLKKIIVQESPYKETFADSEISIIRRMKP